MAKRLLHIGHDTPSADQFVGLEREITIDITKYTIRVHDGASPGGVELAKKDLSNVQTATASIDGKMSAAFVQQLLSALQPIISGTDQAVVLQDSSGNVIDSGLLLGNAAGNVPINNNILNNDLIASHALTSDLSQSLPFTITTFAQTLLDDTSASLMRVTLGLGSAALEAIGTSGSVLGRLNAGKTDSGNNIFTANNTFTGLFKLESTVGSNFSQKITGTGTTFPFLQILDKNNATVGTMEAIDLDGAGGGKLSFKFFDSLLREGVFELWDAGNNPNFKNSVGGRQSFQSGWMLQSGAGVALANTTTTLFFPTAFPGGVSSVVVSGAVTGPNAQDNNPATISSSSTQFTVSSAVNSDVTFWWIAFGY